MNVKTNIHLIFSGYARKGASAALFLLFALGAMAAGAVIVLPLWKFAVTSPETYSATVLLLSAGLLLVYIFLRIRKNHRKMTLNGKAASRNRRNLLLKTGKIAVTIISLYFILVQFTSGAWLRGLAVFSVFFFFIGWLWFGKPNAKE